MTNTKYLIVGQGLAGTLLSFFLQRNNIPHRVVSALNKPSASMVAAGMFNPVVFKRITKSWMIDELLPVMHSTFEQLENLLNISLIHNLNIAKLISSGEKDWWINQIKKNEMQNYFNGFATNSLINGLNTSYEIALIKNSGYVDLQALIQNYNQYLIKNNMLIDCDFRYSDIEFSDHTIKWKNLEVEKIIFCEGAQAINNPFFPKEVFYLAKGDVLTCKIENLETDFIINKDMFILPKGNNIFIIGSTYQHNNTNTVPQEKDRDYLILKAKKLIDQKIQVIEHKVGIRPTVKDRRPILGFHDEHSQVAFFNGLGTKGVMLAPYFANEMINLLQKPNYNIQKDCSISRFLTA